MQNFFWNFFLYGGAPLTLVALLSLIFSLGQRFKDSIYEFLQSPKKLFSLVAIPFLATLFLALSTKIQLKVLSDETNLLSVANMLTLFGKASNTQTWLYYYYLYWPLDIALPTRPLLFPTLVACFHVLWGMHYWNLFVVNILSLFFSLLSASIWLRSNEGENHWSASLLTIVLCTSPILAIVATSGSYDLCSVAFGFLTFFLCQTYFRDKSLTSLRAMIFSAICYSSVRYESILVLPVLAISVFLFDRSFLKKLSPWDYVFIFFTILPLLLQRILTWGQFENPPNVAAFSFQHLRDHIPSFLHAFFLDLEGPFPIIIHWLGIFGMCLLFAEEGAKRLFYTTLSFLTVLLAVCLAHHFGWAGHPTQARIFLPFSFALCLCAFRGINFLAPYFPRSVILLVLLFAFVFHHRYAIHDPLTGQLTMTREMNAIQDFLQKRATKSDLFVYDRPGQIAALGYSAISWEHLKANREIMLTNIKMRLFDRVIFVERRPYKGNYAWDELSKTFDKVLLQDQQISIEEKIAISSVVVKN